MGEICTWLVLHNTGRGECQSLWARLPLRCDNSAGLLPLHLVTATIHAFNEAGAQGSL